MAEQTIQERLDELKQKRDNVGDLFGAADLNTIVEGIEYAMSHGGTASVDITPLVGGGGYKITINDSEGIAHTATVMDGGDAYAVYESTVPEGQTPMSKAEWLASLKGADGQDGQNGQDGADGVGLNASSSKNGKTTTVIISTDETTPVVKTTLTINDGADAVNPFKGWYDAVTSGTAGTDLVVVDDTANLPINPSVGDYAYVKTWDIDTSQTPQTETPVTKIYECVIAGSWTNSGRVVDTSNVSTFQTAQVLNQVKIVNDFEDDSRDNVSSAAQVKALYDEIHGGFIEELGEPISPTANKAFPWRTSGYSYSLDDACDTAPLSSPTGCYRAYKAISKGESYEVVVPAGMISLSCLVVRANNYIRVFPKGLNTSWNSTLIKARVSLNEEGELSVDVINGSEYIGVSESVDVERYESVYMYVNFNNAYNPTLHYVRPIESYTAVGAIPRITELEGKMESVEKSTSDNQNNITNFNENLDVLKEKIDGYEEEVLEKNEHNYYGCWQWDKTDANNGIGKEFDTVRQNATASSDYRMPTTSGPYKVNKGEKIKLDIYLGGGINLHARGVVITKKVSVENEGVTTDSYVVVAYTKNQTERKELYIELNEDGHLLLEDTPEDYYAIGNGEEENGFVNTLVDEYDELYLYITFIKITEYPNQYVALVQYSHVKGLTENVEDLMSQSNSGSDEVIDNSIVPHGIIDTTLAARILRDGGRGYYLGEENVLTVADGGVIEGAEFTRTLDAGGNFNATKGYLDKVLATIPQGKHFMIFADIHYDYNWNDLTSSSANGNHLYYGLVQKQHEVMRYCYEALGGCKVVFLGDLIGMENSEDSIKRIYDYHVQKYYGLFGGDFINVVGAHEENIGSASNSLGKVDEDTIYEKLFSPAKKYGAVFDEKAMEAAMEVDFSDYNPADLPSGETLNKYWRGLAGMTFYKDDPNTKIRFISIVSDMVGKYSKQGSKRAICNVHFVCKAMESVPDDYTVVICFHTTSVSYSTSNNEIKGNVGNFRYSGLYRIMQAAQRFKEKSTYTITKPTDVADATTNAITGLMWNAIGAKYDNLSCDYTGKSGKVVILNGHSHRDGAYWADMLLPSSEVTPYGGFMPYYNWDSEYKAPIGENSVLLILEDRCTLGDTQNGEDFEYCQYSGVRRAPNCCYEGKHSLGTYKEVLFDVVTLTDDNKIVLTRVGAYPVAGSPNDYEPFDATKSYITGDRVIHRKADEARYTRLYEFNKAHSGDWADDDVDEVDLENEDYHYVRTYDLNNLSNQ